MTPVVSWINRDTKKGESMDTSSGDALENWDPEEITALRKLWRENEQPHIIAFNLCRTEQEVLAKARELGLARCCGGLNPKS